MADDIIDDLDVELAAARVRLSQSALNDTEIARASKLAELDNAKSEARANERARRKIDGTARAKDAKRAAAGKYLVEYFDLGYLLPDADMSALPGNGVLVIRNAPPAAKRTFDREIEAKTSDLADIFADLVGQCVVYPDLKKDGDGQKFRAFFDGELGNGCASQIGAAILALGGARADEVKRGRA